MKKVALTLFALLIGYATQAQDTATRKVLITATEMGLKGNVKTYKVTPYKVVDYFGEIKKGEKQDFWNGDVITTFDEKGYKVGTDRFNKNGQLTQKIIYKYDNSGRRTSRDVYNAFGKIVMKNTYIYDAKGNKTDYKAFDAKGALLEVNTYKNDAKGRMIEEIATKSNKDFIAKYTFKYDNAGNITEVCQYTKEENNLDSCARYKYDKKGLMLEVENFNGKGNLTRKTTYKYDDKGNETEIEILDGSGKLIEKKEFSYTYDDKGNWVERVETVNHFPRVFIEREISYY